ncbi:hypothetical protein FQA39_LY08090 [Lamprigera yunnana]|nr:hypothetical protein FQA39_LY08090 [Lamprigera yunnana]
MLEERFNGLETLVNEILLEAALATSLDFCCFNEPPTVSENTQQSRVIVETFEDRDFQYKQQLRKKEKEVEHLHDFLQSKITQNENLKKFIKNSTLNCQKYHKEYKVQNDLQMVGDTEKFVPQITPFLNRLAQTGHAAKETSTDLKREPTKYKIHNRVPVVSHQPSNASKHVTVDDPQTSIGLYHVAAMTTYYGD